MNNVIDMKAWKACQAAAADDMAAEDSVPMNADGMMQLNCPECGAREFLLYCEDMNDPVLRVQCDGCKRLSPMGLDIKATKK